MHNDRRTFLKLAGAVMLAGCGSSSSDPSYPEAPSFILDPAPLSSRLEEDVRAIQTEGHVPGVNVGIWTPRSQWVRSFGLAALQPDRPLDLADSFSWRSVTKSITVTLLLQLLNEQNLSLDTPARRFIGTIPGEDSVTLRHLAGMSSGLLEYVATPEVLDFLIHDPLSPRTPRELFEPALAQGLHFAPGSAYEYCNTNTLLLGEVVEQLGGQPLAQQMQTRIFQPLGMTRTVYLEGVDRPAPATLGYSFDGDQLVEEQISHSLLGAAGALAGPLEDARLWARALSTGSLIQPDQQQQRLQLRPAVNGPIYDGYGLGLGTVQGWIGHTGEGVGYALGFFGEPSSGSQIVILMNGSTISNQPLRLVRRFLSTLGWPIPTPADARP